MLRPFRLEYGERYNMQAGAMLSSLYDSSFRGVSVLYVLFFLIFRFPTLSYLRHRLSREKDTDEWKPLRKVDCKALNDNPGTDTLGRRNKRC
jgi:hypothetical protein